MSLAANEKWYLVEKMAASDSVSGEKIVVNGSSEEDRTNAIKYLREHPSSSYKSFAPQDAWMTAAGLQESGIFSREG